MTCFTARSLLWTNNFLFFSGDWNSLREWYFNWLKENGWKILCLTWKRCRFKYWFPCVRFGVNEISWVCQIDFFYIENYIRYMFRKRCRLKNTSKVQNDVFKSFEVIKKNMYCLESYNWLMFQSYKFIKIAKKVCL